MRDTKDLNESEISMVTTDLDLVIFRYLAIIIYVVILGVITWLSARRKGVEDFLYASHNIGWKTLAISFFASAFSSYNVVVTLTFSFLFGPYILLIFLGVLVAFICIYFIARKYKDIISGRQFNNIVDFVALKFDRKVTNSFNLTLIAILFLFITLQIFINTTIFSEFLGWSKYTSAIFVSLIVLTYTTIGGLKAEIFTDVFQGILMMVIIALVFMVDISTITSESVTSLLTNKTILFGAISLGFAQFLTLLAQPEIWQRVAASRDLNHLKKGLITSWFLLGVIAVPAIIIGMAARGSGTIENPSTLFYDIVEHSAPQWFLPFVVVSLFAAFMSTLDSSLFAISSQIGKYGFLIKKEGLPDDRKIAKRIRISNIIVLVLALIASLFFGNFLKGVFGLISLLTVISVCLVMSLLLKMSSNETFIAIWVGIIAFVFAFFGGYLTEEQPITTLYPSFFLFGYILLQKIVLQICNRSRLKK